MLDLLVALMVFISQVDSMNLHSEWSWNSPLKGWQSSFKLDPAVAA